MTLNDSLLNVISQLDEETLISVWNGYCVANGNTEDFIWNNEEYEFNTEVGENTSPYQAACMLDEWKENENYFVHGIYGIKSFDYASDIVEPSDLANAIERDSSILTDNSSEIEWEDIVSNDFKKFLELNGHSDYEWENDYCPNELLDWDWDDLLEEIEENLKEEDQE